ncbi:hypothetical protein D3C72_1877860 [compost metagenome]
MAVLAVAFPAAVPVSPTVTVTIAARMPIPATAHFAQRRDFVGTVVERRILARLKQEAIAAEIGFLARFPAARAHADALRRVVETDIFEVGDGVAHGLRAAVIIVARIQGQFAGAGQFGRHGGAQQQGAVQGFLQHGLAP